MKISCFLYTVSIIMYGTSLQAVKILKKINTQNKTVQSTSKYPKKLIINVAVANLRTAPEQVSSNLTLPTSASSNPLQASQLLLGDQIVAHKEFVDKNAKKWLRVNALQQSRYAPELGWHGFPGWIQADQAIEVMQYPVCNLVVKNLLAPIFDRQGQIIQMLSIGTKLQGIQNTSTSWKITLPDVSIAWIHDEDVYSLSLHIQESETKLRKNIIATASLFINNFYSWGGRSAQYDGFGISSVDCSSLINLIFAAHGLQIARTAHDQFLTSKHIKSGKSLQPGDLVFFSPVTATKSGRMSHVMLYIGHDKLLEATLSGKSMVRVISFKERIGKPHTMMKSGDRSHNATTRGKVAHQYHVYFSSYLSNKEFTQTLRDCALT